ncbi:MAG: MarR family winged helix-turn-helix transcriptional regulator, partial [Dorea sp.]
DRERGDRSSGRDRRERECRGEGSREGHREHHEHHEHGKHGRHSHEFDADAEGDAGLYARLRQCGHYLFHNGKDHSSQRRVLMILSERNGVMNQRELTEELGTHRASVSELLGKLEKKEYIKRSQDEQDRRQIQIAITEKGMDALQKESRDENEHDMQKLFSILSEEEKNSLYVILGKLVKDWTGKEKHRENEQ